MTEGSELTSMKPGTRQHFEFSRLLVDTIQEYAIFLLDPLGNVMTWNPRIQKLKGYESDEIIGKHFSTFYPKKDIEAGKPEWELDVCRNEGHVEDEGWRIRKDGTKFWANVVITTLRNDDGEIIGFAKVTRDLTERRNHEEELRRANHKLMQQSKQLKNLNEAKDEFISLASHQLRTPASGVKQFLGLLLEGYGGKLSNTQAAYVKQAYDGNERQIDLIDDLLKVAQVDAGKVTLKKAPADLNALLNDITGEQKDKFKSRHQTLLLQLSDDSVVISVDVARFRMAIENLIDNASKYTPEGGTITIELMQSGQEVRLSISDTGVGIDEESAVKLFKKFSRIPNILSESVGGTGLGLYWARKVVELHGGDITVESHIGSGSRFTVVIPVGEKHV